MNIGITITKHLMGKPSILGLSLTLKDMTSDNTIRMIHSLKSNYTESKLNSLLDTLCNYSDDNYMCIGFIWYVDGSWSEIDLDSDLTSIKYRVVPNIPNNIKF